MKRIGSFLTLLAVGSLVVSPPTTHAATMQTFTRDFSDVQTPTCPDGTTPDGAEPVALQGSLHFTIGVTEDQRGGSHARLHVNYQGVTGTGTVSGVTYEVPTTANLNVNMGSANTLTFTVNVRFISHGSAPNFNLHENFHVTINANGEITAVVDNLECS